MLERRILDLDLGDHVQFDDRFLAVEELADLLAATDVFVTPYMSREQSSSGALTFALAAGCAVVSTPLLVRERHALVGRRAGSSASVIPRPSRGALCGLIEDPGRARRSARRGGPDRLDLRLAVDRGRHGERAAGGRVGRTAANADRRTPAWSSPMYAPTTCSRSSTTAGSSSTRTARSRTGRRATASTTSRGSRSSRSSSSAGPATVSGPPSSIARSRSLSTRATPTAPACATS